MIPTTPMTGGEFRATRELLGLTTEWVASRLDVAGRTVRRWDHGSSPVPSGVAEQMRDWSRQATQQVGRLVSSSSGVVTLDSDDDEDGDATLPARWRRHVAARALAERGNLELRYADEAPRAEIVAPPRAAPWSGTPSIEALRPIVGEREWERIEHAGLDGVTVEVVHESDEHLPVSDPLAAPVSMEVSIVTARWTWRSAYLGREVTSGVTVIQVVSGGLAPDGWAETRWWVLDRPVTSDEAQVLAAATRIGIPRHAGGQVL